MSAKNQHQVFNLNQIRIHKQHIVKKKIKKSKTNLVKLPLISQRDKQRLQVYRKNPKILLNNKVTIAKKNLTNIHFIFFQSTQKK